MEAFLKPPEFRKSYLEIRDCLRLHCNRKQSQSQF